MSQAQVIAAANAILTHGASNADNTGGAIVGFEKDMRPFLFPDLERTSKELSYGQSFATMVWNIPAIAAPTLDVPSTQRTFYARRSTVPHRYPELTAFAYTELALNNACYGGIDPNTGLPVVLPPLTPLATFANFSAEIFTGFQRFFERGRNGINWEGEFNQVELRIYIPQADFSTIYVPMPPRKPRKWGRAWTPRWELEHAALVRQRKFARNQAKIEKDNMKLRKRRTAASRKRRAEKKRRDRRKLAAIPKACKPPKKYRVRRRSKRKK